MLDEITMLLRKWKSIEDERRKLQIAYMTLSVVSIIIAGIISLIDAEMGQNFAYIALASIVVFTINAVMWHLMIENIQDKIEEPKKKR